MQGIYTPVKYKIYLVNKREDMDTRYTRDIYEGQHYNIFLQRCTFLHVVIPLVSAVCFCR